MPRPRFRRRALQGYRETSEPTLGDLSTPISICRSNRSPTEEGNWLLGLTPYMNAWAKFDEAPIRPHNGENADGTATHVFVIRSHTQMPAIEVRDYVVRGRHYYKVEFIKNIGVRKDWMAIYTTEQFSEDSPVNKEVEDPSPIPNGDDDNSPSTWISE